MKEKEVRVLVKQESKNWYRFTLVFLTDELRENQETICSFSENFVLREAIDGGALGVLVNTDIAGFLRGMGGDYTREQTKKIALKLKELAIEGVSRWRNRVEYSV